MNIKLLNQIIDAITEEPRRLSMNNWIVPSGSAPCGTAGCIAGHAVILDMVNNGKAANFGEAGRKWIQNAVSFDQPPDWKHADEEGQELLGLTREQKERLFFIEGWPDPFRHNHEQAMDADGRAAATVARIKHFIATDGAE